MIYIYIYIYVYTYTHAEARMIMLYSTHGLTGPAGFNDAGSGLRVFSRMG